MRNFTYICLETGFFFAKDNRMLALQKEKNIDIDSPRFIHNQQAHHLYESCNFRNHPHV